MDISTLPIKKSALNPLWIITLFFLFTEVVLGYAASATTANIQLALTCFVIIFPLFISVAFFIILWHKPKHLYAPTDYQTDQSFLQSLAIHSKSGELATQIEETVMSILSSKETLQKLQKDPTEKVLKETANSIIDDIKRKGFISVNRELFSKSKVKILEIAYENFRTFGEFTDAIYFTLKSVRPFFYGVDWVLKNARTNEILKSKRMIADAQPGRLFEDNRSLEEVGLKPGDSLIVIKPE